MRYAVSVLVTDWTPEFPPITGQSQFTPLFALPGRNSTKSSGRTPFISCFELRNVLKTTDDGRNHIKHFGGLTPQGVYVPWFPGGGGEGSSSPKFSTGSYPQSSPERVTLFPKPSDGGGGNVAPTMLLVRSLLSFFLKTLISPTLNCFCKAFFFFSFQ